MKNDSHVATTVSEVEEKLSNGEVTLNQARTLLGLSPLEGKDTDAYLVKVDTK